jgi:hypothetical protein
MIDEKQVMAMAEYHFDAAKEKMDAAIDSDESRDELIAARTQELIVKRMAAMDTMDIMAGLQYVNEGAASVMRAHILTGNMHVFGLMARALIRMYIESDSEIVAQDWLERIEREANLFGTETN